MISIGNDIIALNAINRQRTNDIRFYSKFITPAELSLYHDQLPFGSFVWLLWSVKESAYKYLKRLDHGLIFGPARIVMQSIRPPEVAPAIIIDDTWEANTVDDGFYNGTVVINNKVLYYRSLVLKNLIATVVTDDAVFRNIYWGIQLVSSPSKDTLSAAVRSSLLSKMRDVFPGAVSHLSEHIAGYPLLFIDDQERPDVLISFSHHGQYVFYCFGCTNVISTPLPNSFAPGSDH